jgi:hypothetical protein
LSLSLFRTGSGDGFVQYLQQRSVQLGRKYARLAVCFSFLHVPCCSLCCRCFGLRLNLHLGVALHRVAPQCRVVADLAWRVSPAALTAGCGASMSRISFGRRNPTSALRVCTPHRCNVLEMYSTNLRKRHHETVQLLQVRASVRMRG